MYDLIDNTSIFGDQQMYDLCLTMNTRFIVNYQFILISKITSHQIIPVYYRQNITSITIRIKQSFQPMGKKSFKRKLNPDSQQSQLYDKITYIETKIIQKINNIKKVKNSFNLCDHFHKINDDNEFDPSINYYDRFWKQYLMTVMFIKRLQDYEAHVEGLESTVAQIQKKFVQREAILNLPALSKVKKSISKHAKMSLINEKQQENQAKKQLQNPLVQLKKQQEVEPHLINYHSSENQIFYE